MTDERALASPSAAELVIVFDYQRELLAAEMGRLFTALAKDYARSYRGRTLAVAWIERGSLLIAIHDAVVKATPYLKDAVEIAKGTKSITDFSKSIRELVSWKKAEATDAKAPTQKAAVLRSVEEIVRIAADSGSEVSIRQMEPDGRILEVNLASREAVEIREREITQRTNARRVAHLIAQSPLPAALPSHLQPDAIADRFERLGHVGSPGRDAVVSAISAVAIVVRDSGNGYLLEPLAAELETRGLHDLAAAVRAEESGNPTVRQTRRGSSTVSRSSDT